MNWADVVKQLPKQVVSETRAALIVGSRIELSDRPELALGALQWAKKQKLELFIVDDVQGLAPKQPIFVGAPLLVAFGLKGDHSKGLSEAEFTKLATSETKRVKAALPSLLPLLDGRKAGPVGPFFVWSGPLCGGTLAKGVFEKEVREGTRSFESSEPIRTWLSSRGASQDHAPGGVFGVSLFRANYDNSDQPPAITAKLIKSGDAKLKKAGLLKESRLYVLPRYD